ncbi:hypothetical protein [Actinomadura parmotrematis]|uniref:Uncharacterized protein n=1 Tax=Actinomadura parmotrematis TaxID=2864039 RepID=A0ABS7FT82_9ACTN|nr:hypothetical protein [Actinomadura parmotrematis]MBW8483614.1 hypothetical protein [Actinomadura parmotrematis]
MQRAKTAAAAATAAAGAGAAAWWLKSRSGAPENAERWLVVTVNRPPGELAAGLAPAPLARLPEPLAELGDDIVVEVRPAPGGKGTELAARLRDPRRAGVVDRVRGNDPRQQVRSALRDAKSLLETGEVLLPDLPTTRPTPVGEVLELATRRAGGEGRL